MSNETHDLALPGLRADNPLAFLAALGTLRAAAAIYGTDAVRMRWGIAGGAWSPVLRVESAQPLDERSFADALHGWLQHNRGREAFAIADDLTLATDAVRAASERAASAAGMGDRHHVDFIAAFGCDGIEQVENGKPSGRMADTALRTMSGAGHQHFLGFMRTLAEDCTAAHLQRSLFDAWRYDDPLEKHTMRWDPVDDIRYALRWRDSSGDPERGRSGTMWGANRLAIEALPLLPTMPARGGQLATVGFSSTRTEGTSWTWPVWSVWASVDVARALLALKQLQLREPPRAELARLGIAEVFRCQRIRQGKYRNLTPARAV
jgi:hypothetical protein